MLCPDGRWESKSDGGELQQRVFMKCRKAGVRLEKRNEDTQGREKTCVIIIGEVLRLREFLHQYDCGGSLPSSSSTGIDLPFPYAESRYHRFQEHAGLHRCLRTH